MIKEQEEQFRMLREQEAKKAREKEKTSNVSPRATAPPELLHEGSVYPPINDAVAGKLQGLRILFKKFKRGILQCLPSRLHRTVLARRTSLRRFLVAISSRQPQA